MSRSRSRNAGYRNLLYEEPSHWAAFALIGVLFAIGVVVLILVLT